MQAEQLAALIEAVADAVIVHADELTVLDQAIGDGDHGLNMRCGLQAVRGDAATTAASALSETFAAIGTQLVMKVGGASGSLDGTWCMAVAQQTAPDGANVLAAFGEAIEAVRTRGKSQPGQKTLLDAVVPVHQALVDGSALSND